MGNAALLSGELHRDCLDAHVLRLTSTQMFLASTNDAHKILELTKNAGIEPRIENALEFAQKSRVLLLRHKKSGVNIDISLGVLPFEEEVVRRSVKHDAGALSIRLPTPEDLIILKAVAHRPKDLDDIREIAANTGIRSLKELGYLL